MRIFFLLFFLSFNLNAANDLICESDNETLKIKLDNKKMYIQYNTEDYKNYSSYITKWSDKLIITEKQFKYIDNERIKCFFNNADLNFLLHFEPSYELKKICKNSKDFDRIKEGVEIVNLNRLTGLLIFDKGKPFYDISNPTKWTQIIKFECKNAF